MKKKDKNKKIIVNCITATRLLGALIMVPLYLLCGSFTTAIIAGIIFTTDFLDGFLARKLHVQSFFGGFLDTICDKLLGISILLILGSINYIFLISILLEIGIFIVNTISIKKGNNVKVSILGKIKTNILDISLVCGLLILLINKTTILLNWLSIVIIISQSIVLIDYIIKSYKQDKKRSKEDFKKEKMILKNKEELIYNLFNTEYYLKHKNDRIKNLFFTTSK